MIGTIFPNVNYWTTIFLGGISWKLPSGVSKHSKLGNPRSIEGGVVRWEISSIEVNEGIFHHDMFDCWRVLIVDGCKFTVRQGTCRIVPHGKTRMLLIIIHR